jgi:type IV pilus assembly protein PilQ
VNQSQGFSSFLMAGAAALALTQPALAAPTPISGVNVRQSSNGVEILLNTPAGEKPQVFAVNRGSTWTADITNSQLRTAEGTFRQENPAPGISLVTVSPLDSNSVRVTVVGQNGAPTGQVIRPNKGGVLFSMAPGGAQAQAPNTPPPNAVAANPGEQQQASNVMVPNPEISMTPLPTNNGVPPLLPNPVPPPVGNMAASTTDSMSQLIELNSSERVPRLVLRDAPAREVLSLLARAAGFNIAYADASSKPGQQSSGPESKDSEGPKVSLDIENEPVQAVFNHVLRITGLEAYREGRTIFVGPRLPNSARNMIMRSVRLNQVPVTTALNFMVSLGAESAVARERQVVSAVAIPVAGTALGAANNTSAGSQVQTTTETRIETQRVDYKDSTPVLRGLQVSGDERSNTMTLVGQPKQVEIALAQLTQLDIRRRQVVVNVRVLDLNLTAFDRWGASFSFGIDQSRIINDAGIALFNFGSRTPARTGLGVREAAGSPVTNLSSTGDASFARGFFAQLQAAVTNSNAKILTDPTLVVQEGQTATVNLTQEVITNFKQEVTLTENGRTGGTVSITIEKGRAGLILPIKIDRIDDNGFISLSVAPSVTQPEREIRSPIPGTEGNIVLLNERRLETGQLRVRDNQTLVLSGIIQDQDRVEVTKVPLLGDIPLLGSLFRRTNRTNERREVIVLLTPKILDESDRANFGYSYQPSPAARQVLDANPGVRQ